MENDVRINAGYVITDSVFIGEAEFVIGKMPNAPAPFVTWECKDGNNYFRGSSISGTGFVGTCRSGIGI